MSPSLKHADACLPVTALKTFEWATKNLILQGLGPFFRVVDDRTGDVYAQTQVFKRNNVHGFIILSHQPFKDGTGSVQVIVWGGHSLRAVTLTLDLNHDAFLSSSSAEFLAPDWIMSGCAAVDTQPETAYLVTANDAILSLKLAVSTNSRYRTTLHIHQLATSVKSILFSADLIALSESHVLIAAGTVFGEIIVWSCFIDGSEPLKADVAVSIHHFFTGHDGSIFGVRISPKIPFLDGGKPGRLLASCSDDRTVRIWDISGCENKSPQDPSAYATDGFELRSTGFGSSAGEGLESESCVAKAFGHAARIWSVVFRPLKGNPKAKIGLVTRGEDCTCVVWDLSWKPSSPATEYQLREVFSRRHHTGKHIWSLDLCSRGEETAVYTGGADGALKSFIIKEDDPSQFSDQEGKVRTSLSKIESQAFDYVASDCLLGCSKNSELQIGTVSPEEDASIVWETVYTLEDSHSYLLITGVPRKRLALVGSVKGLIQMYNHNTRSTSGLLDLGCRPLVLLALESHLHPDSLSFLVIYPSDDKATLVTVLGWDCDCPRTEAVTFGLPRSPFAICSASLIGDGGYLLLGSKLGGFAVYRVSTLNMSSRPLFEHRRIHGREAIKHIQVVSSAMERTGASVEYVLTCGRDSKYCLHAVRVGGDGDETISFETVHRTSSALGGYLEGAYFDDTTGDLMFYGFKGHDFVLRNESKQTDLISIASGGARKTWVFIPSMKGSQATFSWKEESHLHTIRIRDDLNRSLRCSAHGREIRSMDVLDSAQGGRRLFATGSEDTAVRIYALSNPASAGPWGSFECLRVLDAHQSGLQQVTWSKDGQYLFTSAAHEDFFVWRVRHIPPFGFATILMAASPKDDPKSDLRVTSFAVEEVGESECDNGFLVCLTLSNSTIKIFHFSPSAGGRFTLLAKGTYMTNCLTLAHFSRRGSSVNLITAATDGHCTLWDLTDTLQPFYTITPILAAKSSLETPPQPSETITCENRYQIHSNSIKAMELLHLPDTATVVVTGSDDNSLCVSLLLAHPGENAQMSTVSIPDAHAASVTTLKILKPQRSAQSTTFRVASSGNDHRVKIWSVSVDPTKSGTLGIHVEMLLDRYSSVADISSLGLVKGRSDETQESLLVCGVGMELFEANLE